MIESGVIKLDESFFESVINYVNHYLNVYDKYSEYSQEIDEMFSEVEAYTSSEIITIYKEQMHRLNKMLKYYHDMVEQAKTSYEVIRGEFDERDQKMSLSMHRKYYDRGYDW